jgi:hypothetical protein
MKQQIITPKVGIKDETGSIKERVCFPMKWVSAAEEGELWQQLSECDQKADNVTDLKFAVMLEFLAAWTVEMPFIRVIKRGTGGKEEHIDTPLAGENPAEAVREFFKVKTIEQDRMINGVINSYLTRIAPDVVF